jgi:hypothetical protein
MKGGCIRLFFALLAEIHMIIINQITDLFYLQRGCIRGPAFVTLLEIHGSHNPS